MEEKNKNNIMTPVAIVVAGLIVAGAVILTNSGILKLGASKDESGQVASTEDTAENTIPSGPQTFKVSIDDDAVLGDANAPITIIEFSDYECPYCGAAAGTNEELIGMFKAQDETWTAAIPEVRSKYVENGTVKYVFRDMPLPFHNPVATKEALAANCARDQGGDAMYFEFHDELFENSEYNAKTDPESIREIAVKLGLDMTQYDECVDSEKFADEIRKDMDDFQKLSEEVVKRQVAQGLGTPTFFIGRSTESGEIEGTLVSGAQPFQVFENVIEGLLQ